MSRALLADMTRRSLPLTLNETLWCTGTAMLNQIYSTRGIMVMASLNIAYVLFDLLTAVAFSLGTTIGIMVGQELGAGELERAVEAVMSGQVKYCPHGRPVCIELTKKQLEKSFKRS